MIGTQVVTGQLDYATEFAASIFYTPPPVVRYAEEDAWDTTVRVSIEAEPELEVVTPNQQGWRDWHRIFDRANRGVAAERWPPSGARH